MISYLLYINIY